MSAGQRRDRQLEQRPVVHRPAVRADRAAPVGPRAVEQLALGPLLGRQLRGAEVVGAGERADVRRQRRRVVRVPAPQQHPQRRLREAVARAAEPVGVRPRSRTRSRPRPAGAPRRARPPSSGAARARAGTSGCRSRGRPPASAPSASRFSGSAASWPTMKNVMRSRGGRARRARAARGRRGTTGRTPSRRRRGSSCTTTGCPRRASRARDRLASPAALHAAAARQRSSSIAPCALPRSSRRLGTRCVRRSSARSRRSWPAALGGSSDGLVDVERAVHDLGGAHEVQARDARRHRRAPGASSRASGSGTRGAPGRSSPRGHRHVRGPGRPFAAPRRSAPRPRRRRPRRADRPVRRTWAGRRARGHRAASGSTSAVISTTAVNGRSSIRYVR